jgi:cytochrome c oxidase accessory protein FixG
LPPPRPRAASPAGRKPVIRLERRPPLPPPRRSWHQIRKLTHVACVIVFVLLPFFDVMRFDIPRERFYFAGQELYINEFGILFFSLMLLMFVVAAVSMMYGRLYCSYLCPQMIFSEASIALEQGLRKAVSKRLPRLSTAARHRVAAFVFYAVVLVASVFLSFVFISYFVEPRDLFRRLMHFDIVTAGGISGASTTLVTFFDFALVRQTFCTTVCPYGYLQGMLSDDKTLLVSYRDPERKCIECRKCVRVCHMGVDIRNSAHQIECIHCGECIDACREVLGKLGHETLVEYTWGEAGVALSATNQPWWVRLGFRDAKRVVLTLVLLFYASGLGVALSLRQPVLVKLVPDRSRLYWTGAQGEIINRFTLSIANRGSAPAEVRIRLEGLEQGELRLAPNPVHVQGGATVEQAFEVAVPPGSASDLVTAIAFVADASPSGGEQRFKMTFVRPAESPR